MSRKYVSDILVTVLVWCTLAPLAAMLWLLMLAYAYAVGDKKIKWRN